MENDGILLLYEDYNTVSSTYIKQNKNTNYDLVYWFKSVTGRQYKKPRRNRRDIIILRLLLFRFLTSEQLS